MRILLRNHSLVMSVLLMIISTASFAKSHSEDGKNRAEWEKKKDEITYASDYIETKEKGQQTLLIGVSPKKDDALTVPKAKKGQK